MFWYMVMVCGFDIYGMVIIFMMRFGYLWYGYGMVMMFMVSQITVCWVGVGFNYICFVLFIF